MTRYAGPRTVAAARPVDLYVKYFVDYRKTIFEGFVSCVNVALDAVGRVAEVTENVGVSAG